MAFNFGATPAAANPFATPAAATTGTTGFGFGATPAPAATGAPATGTTGFGFGTTAAGTAGAAATAQPQTGLGVGGFGSPPKATGTTGTTGGFGFGGTAAGATGTATGTTGFGFGTAAPAAGAQPQQQPAAQLSSRAHSVTGQYLLQWDNVYNAKHPDCKYRTFLYNMCTAGQGEQAILRERQQNGSGVKEDEWIMAKRQNSDPERMYPQPTHFMVGLKQRAEKQKETVELYHKHIKSVSAKAAELRAIQEKNAATYKKLVLEQIMTERKLLAVTAKVEVMRQHGLKLGPEKHSVLERTNNLLNQMNHPSKFKALHAELQAGLDTKQRLGRPSRMVGGAGADGTADRSAPGSATQSRLVTTYGTVDVNVLRDWTKFLDRMTNGVQSLQQSLSKDREDLKAASDRAAELGRGQDRW